MFVLVFALFNCGDDKTTYPKTRETVDGKSMATPGGGILKTAESGPVRSALGVPEIDINTFQLEIYGLVDSAFSLSWAEILNWPATYSDTIIMYCVEGWEVYGNWKGILVRDLLDKARVRPEGDYILFECAEGYKTALPVSYLIKYDALLAYEVNNAPLRMHDGFPLRLIAFGKFGYKWAKWVNRLKVTNRSEIGYWERQGYSDRADVPVARRKFYEGDNAEPLKY